MYAVGEDDYGVSRVVVPLMRDLVTEYRLLRAFATSTFQCGRRDNGSGTERPSCCCIRLEESE
jgi:hypothetical protein